MKDITLRTAQVILFIFMMGFIFGVSTSRIITKNRVNKMVKAHHRPDFHKHHLLRVLQPNREQEKQLSPYIELHIEESLKLRKGHHKEQIELSEKLLEETRKLLRPKQIKRVQQKIKRMKERRGMPPPPPFPPKGH